jgi:hypothetical protein
MPFQKGHPTYKGCEKGWFGEGDIPPKTAFKKGHKSWSKGIKRPEISGKNHPMYGKHHSEETRKRIGRKGSLNSRWKGGKTKCMGYYKILIPEHPFAVGGYVLEHRLVMEKILGRYLEPFEKVHHKNRIRIDNRPENLVLFIKGENWHSHNCPKCGFHFLIR